MRGMLRDARMLIQLSAHESKGSRRGELPSTDEG
jgi:hypothetical protein